MYLIQILLPLYDNEGETFEQAVYDRVRDELTKKFGGLTAFRSSPAEGIWNEGGRISHDAIIVFEVLTGELERDWWAAYRDDLEARFRQRKMIVLYRHRTIMTRAAVTIRPRVHQGCAYMSTTRSMARRHTEQKAFVRVNIRQSTCGR